MLKTNLYSYRVFKMDDDNDWIDATGTVSPAEQAKFNTAYAIRRLAASEVDSALKNMIPPKDVTIAESVVDGPKSLGNTIKNIEAKTTVIPYAQKSRQHWVTVKVTKENDSINIELIDSKGGASKRPQSEYSENPIKRFGQKLADKVGGLVDKVISTVVGNKELSEMKKEIQAQHPNAKITTKLTKLETQRDNMHCGRHTIENITDIANGNKVETNLEKANTKMLLVNDRIEQSFQTNISLEKSTEQTIEKINKIEVPQKFKEKTTFIDRLPTSFSPDSTPTVGNGISKGQGLG